MREALQGMGMNFYQSVFEIEPGPFRGTFDLLIGYLHVAAEETIDLRQLILDTGELVSVGDYKL